MANKRRDIYKAKPMTEGKKAVIQGLLNEYDIQSAEDIQDALKDLLSGTIQTMLETEMNEHLGYEKYARDDEPNYRNGTKPKTVRSKYGEFSSSRTTHKQWVTFSLNLCASQIAPVSMHNKTEPLALSTATLVKKFPSSV